MAPDLPDPSDGWADGRSPYVWDKQLDMDARVARGVLRPDWNRPPVRRAIVGLVFVVCVFVVVPVVAMLIAAG